MRAARGRAMLVAGFFLTQLYVYASLVLRSSKTPRYREPPKPPDGTTEPPSITYAGRMGGGRKRKRSRRGRQHRSQSPRRPRSLSSDQTAGYDASDQTAGYDASDEGEESTQVTLICVNKSCNGSFQVSTDEYESSAAGGGAASRLCPSCVANLAVLVECSRSVCGALEMVRFDDRSKMGSYCVNEMDAEHRCKKCGLFPTTSKGTKPVGEFFRPPSADTPTYKPEDIRRNDVIISSSFGRHGVKMRHLHHPGNTLLYNKCYEERDAFERTVGMSQKTRENLADGSDVLPGKATEEMISERHRIVEAIHDDVVMRGGRFFRPLCKEELEDLGDDEPSKSTVLVEVPEGVAKLHIERFMIQRCRDTAGNTGYLSLKQRKENPCRGRIQDWTLRCPLERYRGATLSPSATLPLQGRQSSVQMSFLASKVIPERSLRLPSLMAANTLKFL